MIPCPSCGFNTLSESIYGSYIICKICEWEDDGVQLANPASAGGANKISLIESQKNILNKIPIKVKEYNNIKRDNNWRPLRNDEIIKYENERNIKYWKNMAIVKIEETYWFQNK